jgi:tellurite resistance protein
MNHAIGRTPVSLFAIVPGVADLGLGWRVAARVWGLPPLIGETLLAIAALIWALLLLLYVAKWALYRDAALQEAAHPVLCCFIGLIPIGGLLIALGLLPYSRGAALVLFLLAALAQCAFAIWRGGGLWRGGRSDASTTPIMYLPVVGGNFVIATVSGALGFAAWGQLFFGAAVLSWLALESVILHRLYTQEPLPPALRPSLGIMLAPPAVGTVAYLAINRDGPPDLAAHLLFGYALLQALLLLRLLPWIRQQPFAASYWAFSFGVAALPLGALRMLERGEEGPIAQLAAPLFIAANLVIGVLALATLWLLSKRRLLPAPAGPPAGGAPA